MTLALPRNTANLIVLLRTVLVFLVVDLWSQEAPGPRLAGLAVLAAAFIMDGLDGWVARRLKTASRLGGLLDTLGDRITESVLLVFLAWQRLIPLFVPMVFISRGFAADLVRHLNFKAGESTFSVNRSRWGALLVASPASRALYLCMKMALFFLAGAFLVGEAGHGPVCMCGADRREMLQDLVRLSVVLTLFNLARFGLLVYDSRAVLKAALDETAEASPEAGPRK
ncbi:MAG: CDP-alcohol phosphatidyltransferase family protein [Elusimicrobia bacterium]|nr:CDP-alcohol phosphatidyltransferase family protein [Elusimicrobiota bacterium]